MSENPFPISFPQQRLWFLAELDPNNPAYNLPRVFRVVGQLDVSALTSAMNDLVARHSELRAVFTTVNDEPWQAVQSAVVIDLPTIDLTHLEDDDERANEALRIAREEGCRPFDLISGPLVRATLVRTGAEEHLLVLVMHHIITDGWSMSIFFRELAEFYEAATERRPPELPQLTLGYADFVHWQREYLRGEVASGQIEYWKKKLQGAETTLDLPADHPRPAVQSGRGASERFVLKQSTAERLKQLGHSEGATLFMTLLAIFQALLWRYTNQDSILVGTPVAGRTEVELENLIGFFVNTLILRADLSDDMSFRELLRQVRTNALEAYTNQDTPFEKLVEELNPERSLNRTPLFQAMLILQNAPRQKLEVPGLMLEEVEFESGIAKLDLVLEVIELVDLHCTLEYNSDLFDSTTIQRMIEHFEILIDAALEDPDARIATAPLLSVDERNRILLDWNKTEAGSYPTDVCIHTAFERQASQTSDAVAFVHEGKQLTFRQLNERSNRLAHYLIRQGVTPGTLVGISVERSLDMAVGLLGILKSGAAYVPLDPSQPQQRFSAMLEDSGVGIVVTQHALQARLAECGTQLVLLDTESSVFDQESSENPSTPQSSDSLAYLIYTSGSTGTPKGVEGTHRASMNRFAWMWSTYPFRTGETCCQKTALSFVDSIWEIFGPLLRGIRNVIIPEKIILDPEQFVRVLSRYAVTRIVLVPSLLRMLLDQAGNLATRLPMLKLWSASGEVLTTDLARRFASAHPQATLLNIYGSSEVAADVTWHEVRGEDTAPTVPIGRPIGNTQVYILDRHLNPVPIGVRGEIYVGGVCVARGYRNKPALTAERFIRNPLEGAASNRLYKTGDLGRFLRDGSVEYLGRTDNQVKIRGFRIELGEIEAVLRSHPSVREAAVVVQNEGQQLVAYVATSDGEPLATAELRRFARSALPEYMVPSIYVGLAEFPLLPSGKINRKALPPVAVNAVPDRAYVAPRTETEEVLTSIWREVLKADRIGIEDNFFELGGHSLLAVQVIARIRRTFDVEVPISAIFEQLAIAGLAEEVEKAKATGVKARKPILPPRPPDNGRDTLIAQLDKLSPEEARILLDRLVARTSSEKAGAISGRDAANPEPGS